MSLSIIIPCKNEEKHIGHLFESLTQQHLPKGTEIIVADADSTDKTGVIIKAYTSMLPIKKISGGTSEIGRLNGSNIAKGDILLFLDADCYFKHSKSIANSLSKIKQGSDLVGCSTRVENNRIVNFLHTLINMVTSLFNIFIFRGFIMVKKDRLATIKNLNRIHIDKKSSFIDEYVYTDNLKFKGLGIIQTFKKLIKRK